LRTFSDKIMRKDKMLRGLYRAAPPGGLPGLGAYLRRNT
jgi:hypothetical protein